MNHFTSNCWTCC